MVVGIGVCACGLAVFNAFLSNVPAAELSVALSRYARRAAQLGRKHGSP